MSTCPTRRSRGKLRVRANIRMPASSTTKYTSGTTPTGDPNAR
jgi:hypothetical protein